MEVIVEKLAACENKEACLREAYDILSKKYRGHRIRTYTRFWQALTHDLHTLWGRESIHCHAINLHLRALLVRSGWFKDDDITLHWSLVWYISPHQYVKVRMGPEQTINVDIWAKVYGIRFGDYARGFNS